MSWWDEADGDARIGTDRDIRIETKHSDATPVVRWSQVLTGLSGEVLQSVRRMDDTFGALATNPDTVEFDTHLSAVVTLARLVRCIEKTPAHARTVSMELVFSHAGYECNCVYYELLHRMIFVAERFLWITTARDVGDPWTSAATTLRLSQRKTMRAHCKALIALANFTHACVSSKWHDVPLPVTATLPALALLVRMVRAYGLWNAAVVHCNGTPPDAEVGHHVLVVSNCTTVLNLLNDARETFRRHTGDVALAGGVFSLGNHAHVVHLDNETALRKAESHRSKATAAPSADVRSWTLMLHIVFWRTAAALWSHTHEHRAARIAYELQSFWSETSPQLQAWQARRSLLASKPLPTWQELEATAVNEVQTSCSALRTGDASLLADPLQVFASNPHGSAPPNGAASHASA